MERAEVTFRLSRTSLIILPRFRWVQISVIHAILSVKVSANSNLIMAGTIGFMFVIIVSRLDSFLFFEQDSQD